MAANNAQIKQTDGLFTILENYFKLISRTWEAFRLNMGTFIGVYLLPLTIATVGALALLGRAGEDFKGISFTAESAVFAGIAAVGLTAIFITLSIATILTQLASVRGQKIGVRDAIDQAQSYFWKFTGFSILLVLVVLAGTILFIIPGIILAVLMSLASYNMIDKNLSPLEGIKQGLQIGKKNWKLLAALVIFQMLLQTPSIVPGIGSLVSTGLSIAYFCLPAMIYTTVMSKEK